MATCLKCSSIPSRTRPPFPASPAKSLEPRAGLLLTLAGAHATPSEAHAALLDAIPESLKPSYMPPVEDVYRAGRAEWRKASIKYREETGLFADMYPHTLIAPWEDHYTVLKNEPLLWLYD